MNNRRRKDDPFADLELFEVREVSKIDAGLADVLNKGLLGRSDAPSAAHLRQLFASRTRVPLGEVLGTLWPDLEESRVLNLYRGFKMRLNQRFQKAEVNLLLASDQDNRPVEAKWCWFEEQLSAEEVLIRKTMTLIENRQLPADEEQLERQYVPVPVTMGLPIASFGREMRAFALAAASAAWNALKKESRLLLEHVIARLDPLITFSTTLEHKRATAGFACEPVSTEGHRKEQLHEALKAEGPAGLEFLHLSATLAAFRTAQALRSSGPGGTLQFLMELPGELLTSAHFTTLLDEYRAAWHGQVLFVLRGPLAHHHGPRLQQLYADRGVKFAAVDLAAWPTADRASLEHAIELTLVERKQSAADAAEVARWLMPHCVAGKTLLLQGVDAATPLGLLQQLAARLPGQRLLVQGLPKPVEDHWSHWLTALRSYSFAGGYGLASSHLAEAVRELERFLVEPTEPAGVRQFRGPLHLLKLAGAPNQQPLTWGILSSATPPTADLRGLLHGVDFLIVAQRHPGLAIEQLTIEQARTYLETFRQGDKGEAALHDERERDYPLAGVVKFKVRSHAPCALTAPETDTAGADQPEPSFEDGVEFLLRWVREPNLPFCVLLGDYGVGKTYLCRIFDVTLRQLRQDDPQKYKHLPLPLYFDLRNASVQKDGQIVSLTDMLQQLCDRFGLAELSVPGLLAGVRKGVFLLIFDGIDEKTRYLHKGDEQRDFFRELRAAAPPADRAQAKVLMACRTHYFSNQDEEHGRLEGGSSVGHKDGFTARDFRYGYLQGFDDDQILQYLQNHLEPSETGPALELLRNVHDLNNLSRRPYLLSILLHHLPKVRWRAGSDQRVSAADVYEWVVKEWVNREGVAHQVSAADKMRFLEELAHELWRKKTQRLHADELNQWLQKQLPAVVPALTITNNTQITMFDLELRTDTLLTRSADGFYSFSHSSFHEFFLARQLARRLSAGDIGVLDLPRLNKETLDFCIDLLHGPRGDAAQARTVLEHLLETKYVAQQSENAVWLSLLWKDLRSGTAPQPGTIRLDGAELRGWDLSGRRLSRLMLRDAALYDCNFDKTELPEGDFTGARLVNVSAASAKWRGVALRGAHPVNVNWSDADLEDADFSAATGTALYLQHSKLKGACFAGAHLSSARLFAATGLDAATLERAFDLDRSGPRIDLPETIEPRPGGSMERLPLSNGRGADGERVDTELRLVPPNAAHVGGVSAVSWSPDGRWLASGGDDGTVRLWEAASGKPLRTLAGHKGSVSSVAFAADGGTLASGGSDGTVRLWEAATGKPLRTLTGHEGYVWTVAFAADGGTLASGGSDGTVRLWEAASGKPLRTLAGHKGSVSSVAFAADGGTLASGGDDGTVRLWEAATGKPLRTLAGHKGSVSSVAFAADGGTLASGGDDGTVRLWEAATGKPLRTLAGHKGSVLAVAFAADGGTLASGGDDGTVRLWEAATGKPLRTLAGHKGSVLAVAFAADGGTLASGGDDGTVRLWETFSDKPLRTLEKHKRIVPAVAFTADGGILASGGYDGTVRLWETATGKLLRTLEGHNGYVVTVAFAAQGSIVATGGFDRTVRLWEAATGKLLRVLEGHKDIVRTVAFAVDGSTLATGSWDNTVRLWEAATGRPLCTLQGHEYCVRAVAFAPNGGILASGSDDGTVRLWQTATGQPLYTLKEAITSVLTVAFGADGSILASGGLDDEVHLWEAATGKLLRTLAGHKRNVPTVAFAADNCILASGDDGGAVRLWEAATGKLLRTLEGHEGPVTAVAFARDSGILASGSEDGTIRLWNWQTGECPAILHAESGGDWLCYTPDGYFDGSEAAIAASGFAHGMVWYPSLPEWVQHFQRPDILKERLRPMSQKPVQSKKRAKK